jgi:DNA-binding NtrC family response regulator
MSSQAGPFLVRSLGAGMLAHAGFRVIEAVDGDEALKFLRADSDVHFLITDGHLAGTLDGLALAPQVQHRGRRIGIIVISGQASPPPASRQQPFPSEAAMMRTPWSGMPVN